MVNLALFIMAIAGVVLAVTIMLVTPEQHQAIGDIAAFASFVLCISLGIYIDLNYNIPEVKENEKNL